MWDNNSVALIPKPSLDYVLYVPSKTTVFNAGSGRVCGRNIIQDRFILFFFFCCLFSLNNSNNNKKNQVTHCNMSLGKDYIDNTKRNLMKASVSPSPQYSAGVAQPKRFLQEHALFNSHVLLGECFDFGTSSYIWWYLGIIQVKWNLDIAFAILLHLPWEKT